MSIETAGLTEPLKFNRESTQSSNEIESWDDGVQRLKEFKEAHGHFTIPDDIEDYKPLHHWLRSQQEEYTKLENGGTSTLLTGKRITQLNRIGFYFGNSCFNRTVDTAVGTSTKAEGRFYGFDYWLGHLRDFKVCNGHCRVPPNMEEYKSLYNWISKCRKRFRNRMRGNSDAMSDEEILKLRDVGFQFPRSLEDKVNELERFREIHGHFLVSRFTGNHKSLGLWLYNRQLDFARVKRGESAKLITSDLVRQLEEIGFNLDGPFADDEIWTIRIRQLKRFIIKYGHYRVPSSGEYRQLCEWLQDTRNEYKKLKKGERSLLTKDRVRQFLEIERLLKDSRPPSSQHDMSSPEATRRHATATVTPRHQSDDTYDAFQIPGVVTQSPNSPVCYPQPKEVPIPAFINDLVDDIDSILEKSNHWERYYYARPGGGRPNQFWMEIGDRDGIDFFS